MTANSTSKQARWWWAVGNQEKSGSLAELDRVCTSGEVAEKDITIWWEGSTLSILPSQRHDLYFFKSEGETRSAKLLHEIETEAGALIWGPSLPPAGTPLERLKTVEIRTQPAIGDFLTSRAGYSHTILSGSNNSGKSLLLKRIRSSLGTTSSMLSSNRFYHFDELPYVARAGGDKEREQRHQTFVQQLYSHHHNQESSDFAVQNQIGRLTDEQRDRILSLCSDLMGESFVVSQRDPANKCSPYDLLVGGRPLSAASSGTRLLLGLIAGCADESVDTLLIDEPEIGLSPTLQRKVAELLLNPEQRKRWLPSLHRVFIATHSQFFLDWAVPRNNFVVSKNDGEIFIRQVFSWAEFHRLNMSMLGNDLTSVSFPEAIVLVEGQTDLAYIQQILRFRSIHGSIAVVDANGDGGVPAKLRFLSQVFGDPQKSPFINRVFVVVDSINGLRAEQITKLGGRLFVLPKNGIEHFYPPCLLAHRFSIDEASAVPVISGNEVKCNDISFSKVELSRLILAELTAVTPIPAPLSEIIDEILRAAS